MKFLEVLKARFASKGKTKPDDVEPIEPPSASTVNISVFDLGTNRDQQITAPIISALNAEHEISGDLRSHILATAAGEIFYSHSQRDNPRVQSAIRRLALVYPEGMHVSVQAVDTATISEFYRKEAQNRSSYTGKKVSDSSRMQRDMIAIVANASALNASDIHIIVNQHRSVVRFRVDGVMREIMDLPPQYSFELLSAAFAMADASDTSYQRLAYQAARVSSLRTELPAGVQSLRLQFNPLANDGRYLILRMLYSGEGQKVSLEQLGYNTAQIKMLATMSARPVGINIVSGPTGSGKSTTLKAVLERLIEKRDGEINLITIEDPPEYVIDAAQQMPVTNAKTQEERNEAFTAAISAGLRSDPDVLMIGEVRDKASADLAVEGALSGHPIYASLHANNAMDILTRLRDMGIEDFKVFDHTVFSGLVGQRLVRKLCPHCRIEIEEAIARGQVDELEQERIAKMVQVTPVELRGRQLYTAGPGCTHCNKGYNGRFVISEIILPDYQFMRHMVDNKKLEAKDYWFKHLGGIDLLGAAWIRALNGLTSPLDIENTVALLEPQSGHEEALRNWAGAGE